MTDNTIVTTPASKGEATAFNAPKSATSVTPTSNAATTTALPRGLARFLGTWALRSCLATRNSQTCEGCHLRVLCRCAQEDFRVDVAIEQKVWAVLTLCAGVSILYA